mmetsp:Transcript_87045/g.186562  ORF Transcript_87045/g.186562 Transcript_87045/m.186562 type:complete len:316 (-) Transcript_87045:34-981(-)
MLSPRCGLFGSCGVIPGRSRTALVLVGAIILSCPAPGASKDVSVYFGCGCFWHVQHEFIHAEQAILGRNSATYTALAGYAGGNSLNRESMVCYDDYAGHGHTEVVGLRIPENSISAFADVYWDLFKGINRVDTMDVGPAYRAAIGLPGGMSSPLLAEIDAAQTGRQHHFLLQAGQGNDRDTLGEALVWVYDSDKYPFMQAELYHQFHDDFMPGGDYAASYNALASAFESTCRMGPTGCRSDTTQKAAGCTEHAALRAPVAPARDMQQHGGAGGSGRAIFPTNDAPSPVPASSVASTSDRWLRRGLIASALAGLGS